MSLVNFLDVDVFQPIKNSKEAVTKHHTNCANCGVAKTDGIKLTPCHICDLVSYCSEECKNNHQEAHDAECKVRNLEMFDKILFRQPEGSHLGDCPLCCLPMPLDVKYQVAAECCGKLICSGCIYANKKREFRERLIHRCVFCRKVNPKTDEEHDKYLEERAEKNDPIALLKIGGNKYKEGKCEEAVQYYSKAAEFGDVESRYRLSMMYLHGEGVQEDLEAVRQNMIEAALCGHPIARHNMGGIDECNGMYDRAVKHYIISANLGFDESLNALKRCYKNGHVSKEDYAGALRAHQAAVDAMKSPQRDAAETEE